MRHPSHPRTLGTLGLALSAALLLPGAPAADAAGPTCFGETPTITGDGYVEGTSGDDVILATEGSEVHAFAGDDRICGAGLVYAGPGHDRVFFRGDGADVLLSGGSGGDRIFYLGSEGARLEGNDGNDVLRTGPGRQYVVGGRGNDHISLGKGADYANGGADRDHIEGGPGDDAASGGAGKDTCTHVERQQACER